MRYNYRVYAHGQYTNGKVEATSVKEVSDYLRSNGFLPVYIGKNESLGKYLLPKLFNRVSQDDIINFTRQFAIMLNAGLTITGSLELLVRQTDQEGPRELFNDINTSIKSGDSFSKALSKHSHQFTTLYLSLIKAGEASGKLNEIMARMANDLEKQREFMAKVKGTMTYPIIVVLGIIGVMVILLTVVVPQLTGLYKDLGVELPLQTRIVIALSDFIIGRWYIMIAITVIAIVGLRKLFATDKYRLFFDTFVLKIPKFGELITMSTLVGSTRTLALLIQSGVLMLDSLSIVTNSTGNVVYQNSFRNIYRNIQNGQTLSDSFQKEDVFPPILVQMIAVGERTGKLDEVLGKISQFFEMQSDMAIKTVTTLIEPLTLVVLGGLVGLVVMSVITPIYTLTTSMGQ